MFKVIREEKITSRNITPLTLKYRKSELGRYYCFICAIKSGLNPSKVKAAPKRKHTITVLPAVFAVSAAF